MLVLTHIIIAISSLGYSTYLFIKPYRSGFYVSYSLVGLTLATGTYLVWSTHAHMLQACVTGVLYLGIVSLNTVVAHYRLSEK